MAQWASFAFRNWQMILAIAQMPETLHTLIWLAPPCTKKIIRFSLEGFIKFKSLSCKTSDLAAIDQARLRDNFSSDNMMDMRPIMPSFLLPDTKTSAEVPVETMLTPKAAQKACSSKRKRTENAITAYEQERLDRIARNQKVMAKLGIKEAWKDFHEGVMGAKKAPKVKKQKTSLPAREQLIVRRKSARLDTAQRPVYQDSKAFEALMSSDRSNSDTEKISPRQRLKAYWSAKRRPQA